MPNNTRVNIEVVRMVSSVVEDEDPLSVFGTDKVFFADSALVDERRRLPVSAFASFLWLSSFITLKI